MSDMKRQLDQLTCQDVSGAIDLEMKLKALILDKVHSMDVVQQLISANVTSVNDWHWQKQLR